MAKVVKCLCEECFFNQEHQCHANNIQVHSIGDHKVETSEGTCCDTFKPKKSENNFIQFSRIIIAIP